MNLEEAWKHIQKHGPTRVLINEEGEAVPPARAMDIPGMKKISVVFIRDDGWSLGAPEHLRHVAEEMWQDQWIGYANYPDEEPTVYP